MDKLRRVYLAVRHFLWNVDLGTWIAHAGQGFLVAAAFDARGFNGEAPFLALAYHGGARELPGIVKSAKAGDTLRLVDGMFDYASFFVGMALYYAIFGGR